MGFSYYIPGDDGIHAFITGPNGVGMTDLGTLGGESRAYGINDSGQVAGSAIPPPDYDYNAFITGPNGVGITNLGTLGGTNSAAHGINDSGQVAGSYHNGRDHAFITGPNGVGMADIGTLGGSESIAYSINDSGQVVGYSLTPGDTSAHAFVTGPNGVGMTDLGTLGGRFSFASDINDSGQVVGYVDAPGAPVYHAFLYSNGVMLDLSVLPVVTAGWSDLDPYAINNNGQIVGLGHRLDGRPEAFLLSFDPSDIPPPIPEPQTYAMLLAGLGVLGFMARRRKELAA